LGVTSRATDGIAVTQVSAFLDFPPHGRHHSRMPRSPLPRVRKLALSFPEAHEVEAWGEPTFRVKNKIFAMYADSGNHHGSGRPAIWCKAKAVNQRLMIDAAPDRFFSPPYVGPSGWVGVWLDRGVDWDELLGLLRDGYRMTAPRKLLERLKDD